MRWFGKPAEAGPASGTGLVPEPLQVTFNREILGMKLNGLRAAISEAGGVDGLETFIEALRSKHDVFAGIVAKGADMDGADLCTLGGLVFTARRKLGPLLARREAELLQGVRELAAEPGPAIEGRLHAFGTLAGEDRKLQRALWDFGAEILHFRDPDGVPLASRWVWNTATRTGALREFIRGNDTLRDIPIGDTVAAIEGARRWFHDVLADEGFYRDLPFITDLIWAQAYSDYARSLSMHMGLIDAQFGAKQDPLELVVKMLGIDAPGGRLKTVRDDTLH
jgi:hypothetical protein